MKSSCFRISIFKRTLAHLRWGLRSWPEWPKQSPKWIFAILLGDSWKGFKGRLVRGFQDSKKEGVSKIFYIVGGNLRQKGRGCNRFIWSNLIRLLSSVGWIFCRWHAAERTTWIGRDFLSKRISSVHFLLLCNCKLAHKLPIQMRRKKTFRKRKNHGEKWVERFL